MRAGEPPAVALTPDLLYRILLAEIAAQRGRFDVASEQYLRLAKDTSDPRLAQKAFRAAIISRNMTRAHEAAQQWVLLAPGDRAEVAFVADNPGRWLIHCHVLEHHAGGMGTHFEVQA